ncbi:cytoplasmic tRNA 2-thiolation protein 1-like protein [Perkinsela sp. CCAP 1560/4]|nr:cytoplasmic tRNA 2-thiolation protein 1-like protein [Perkinsela sp. CCAP 1560/4]|eukprot:KNH03657.1 cytoplasmic tRNA 2-thiolation protein 1-like protein [Perkinsela sp. CCAP 1560/4]
MNVTKRKCGYCHEKPPSLKRPKNGIFVCKSCFLSIFEEEVHETIISNNLFSKGEVIAVGASGGKDSTVLIELLHTLNKRYDYGIDIVLLSIDEGIQGYREPSLEAVRRNQQKYDLPLHIFSYESLYGVTMDQVVDKIGHKSNCTYCGVFRRQALDRGAKKLCADKIATGHNADDIAESVLMNFFRCDTMRLPQCTSITTLEGDEKKDNDPWNMPRVKPLKLTYQKEIVLYAHYKQLDYFSTECTHSHEAFRGHARTFIKDLERIKPESILNMIHSIDHSVAMEDNKAKGSAPPNQNQRTTKPQRLCKRCGYMSSQEICRACELLQNLNIA